MQNTISTDFYSNRRGEIFAIVNERGEHRIIENVERFRYSADMIYDEAVRGFDGFPYFDSWDYDGLGFAVVEDNLIMDNELDYIGSISKGKTSLNYAKMSSSVYKIFSQMAS